MKVQQVLDQLRATPLRMRELTSRVPPELLRTSPGPDEWSANDVLAHLRACSDRWGEAAKSSRPRSAHSSANGKCCSRS